ncbi:MAG: ubiquinol-cytochrome c reductase iron-sulfur subunit [Erythrobacter sp.]|uniref:ubiquinol-cytochrome c reductase iron-sulfur subunit n=1 Tax=Erythrobacter sp. TaxID=1042 RepID=UPI003C7880A9
MASTGAQDTVGAEPAGHDAGVHHEDGVRRRDWIHIAAVSTAGVAAASVLFPLISQMAPSADVLAASTTDVDISALQPGQSVKAEFRKQPLFVTRLTDATIAAVTDADVSDLRDPQTLAERTQEADPSILVQLGVCTHLGCVPLGAAEGEDKGDYNGYFCPCHGSHYDPIGRIRKGPAPTNLVVPEFEFVSDSVIRVG